MRPGATLLVWCALCAGLVVEVVAAVSGAPSLTPFVGIAMAVLVAFTFMRLGNGQGLVPVFALAGVFWLCVLLALGSLDVATRHDVR